MADGYPNEIPLISPNFKAVSMQYALAQGIANTYSNQPDAGVKIDLATDGPGKQAIDGMIARAIRMVEVSPAAKKLLAKPEWTMDERVQWEKTIANIGRDVIHEEPRFGEYRLERNKPMTPISITEITKDTNFHCEPMATLAGIMVQKMENHFLEPSEDRAQLKRRTDYYVTAGILYRSSFQKDLKPKDHIKSLQDNALLHGFVVSPITANYIEGTTGRPNGYFSGAEQPYKKNDIPGYTFDDYLAGFPMISEGAGFTVGYNGSPASQAMATERKNEIAKKNYATLDTLRSTTPIYDFIQFADERNLLKMQGLCDMRANVSLRATDMIDHIEGTIEKAYHPKGRTLTQLACDANKVDFAMTPDELKSSFFGNRMFQWGVLRVFAENLFEHGFDYVGKNQWTEAELTAYLAQGIDNVWVQRPIPANAPLGANNFEQTARAYYDALPAKNLTLKLANNTEEKIPFHAYLEICRMEYASRGGKPEAINSPGTVVPVIYNPDRAYEVLKNLKGRTIEKYEQEEATLQTYTNVTLINRPGVDDTLSILAKSVISGDAATWGGDLKVQITDTAGEIAAPGKTPGSKAATARRVN